MKVSDVGFFDDAFSEVLIEEENQAKETEAEEVGDLVIESKFIEILRWCDPLAKKIRPGTDIAKDLNIDSLDAVEIAMKVEEEFNIEIYNEEIQDIKTVKQAINLIRKKLTSDDTVSYNMFIS